MFDRYISQILLLLRQELLKFKVHFFYTNKKIIWLERKIFESSRKILKESRIFFNEKQLFCSRIFMIRDDQTLQNYIFISRILLLNQVNFFINVLLRKNFLVIKLTFIHTNKNKIKTHNLALKNVYIFK